ncbi:MULTISPECIES: hypothetical protein [Thermoactinomyces]|uniref:Uncharacterized protein n=1 Tax=Thermoactinomyces vulgaris TaxID=2026 RepID=A0ABS0QKC0_THEVU|nr:MULTISPECIES: hypothetical protein [Thermoactinomyces]KYQ85641.1 hypothetical protein AYX07_12785 [Thermoactinomyces sp. AS95]MBA4552527.1 hypothetical protein [Thermoactinomyces vulgaris]MBA4597697.1 hypothetical protein [Thermoactinomyces vulgaris]MBH8584531.1 hypothetical protein [Thermoactinomyces sp. CICC 10735]MBH8587024.1 hypothetical protein [Thermoactinomyces sp. CICC 10520]
MSFRFQVGERYRDLYQIEYVVRFFDGELAVARKGSQRYYLQSSRLEKQAPISRAIAHYRSFEHPLVIPYEDVYAEDRSIVFVRPYVPILPLREVFANHEVEEAKLVEWGKQLLGLEKDLRAQPMRMYLLLDPGNIGVTEHNEELKVLFCGTETITAQKNILDWGTFFYSLLSGEPVDKPIQRLPNDFKASKKMVRLIQRSLQNDSPDSVLSHIKQYEKVGLLDRLFGSGGEKKKDPKPRKSPVKHQPSTTDTPVSSASEPQEPAETKKAEAAKVTSDIPETIQKKQEEDYIASLKEEFEKRQKEALEKQRKELEKRQQELLERQRLEFEKREQELLQKQKEEFKQQIEEPEQRENWEREIAERERMLEEQKRKEEEEKARQEEERLKQERLEQERIALEQEERLQKELAKVEEERIKWEQKQKDLEKKEEELREKLQKEFEEMAKSLLQKQEEEFKRRQEELLQQQRDLLESQTKKRLERHREELEQTSRHYLITPDTKPRASLLDLEKENKAKKENEQPKENTQPQQDDRERLRKEKLAKENKDHDELVKQFEEYMNQMYPK